MEGVRLHVRRFGDPTGRPVLAVHGIKGHGDRWRLLGGALAGHQLYAVDLRGHGRSTPEPPWSIEQHVADLLATLDGLSLDTVDVIGHSFGGLLAVHLAHHAGGRVRRVVLLDPAIGIPGWAAAERAAAELVTPTFPDPAVARVDRAERWPPLADPTVVDDEIAQNLVRGDDGRWRWRYAPAAVVTAFSEMARPLLLPPEGVPTLLVRAARALVVHPALQEAARAARHVTLVALDCHHEIPLERPAETAELVAGFLDK